MDLSIFERLKLENNMNNTYKKKKLLKHNILAIRRYIDDNKF